MVDFHTHWVARGQAKTLLDSIFHFLWKYVSILLKPKKYRKEERLEEMGCLIHFNSKIVSLAEQSQHVPATETFLCNSCWDNIMVSSWSKRDACGIANQSKKR